MQNPLRYLPSKRNLLALIAGFLITFGAWWWFHTRPSSTDTPVEITEFEWIENAVGKARSWHSTTFGTLNGQAVQEDRDVICPDEAHTITRMTDKAGTLQLAHESVEASGTVYMRDATGPWVSQPGGATNSCAEGPMAGPEPFLSVLRRLKPTSSLQPEDMYAVEGRPCRTWVLYSSGTAMGMICVDEETHLPLEFRIGNLKVQYSNWNLPAAIPIPDTVLH